MGWLKDAWNDDRPIFRIRRIKIDDTPKADQEKMKLIEENKELKKQLKMKKIKAIDVEDYKLLE